MSLCTLIVGDIVSQMEYKAIGLNILHHRRMRDLTQEQLALAVGMSRSRLSDIERGKCNFSLEAIMKIAAVLKVDYHILLDTK